MVKFICIVATLPVTYMNPTSATHILSDKKVRCEKQGLQLADSGHANR